MRMPRRDLAVAIYARYSTDRQDARSIDDQLRRCREYAKANGWDVAGEYADAAVSGAHTERAEMQRMLKIALNKGAASFGMVLVDDLSRLSRDLGATWRIVFEDLASAGVSVVDVSTGMSSDAAGARLTFGALALVNDTFLQLVRIETHRGLQGRALAGFWTGGRVYGYKTVEEENPPDPEHRRKVPVIEPREAELVRRVFRLFVDGWSLKRIASTLNEEGIPAPHDRGRGNKIGHGWPHTTIRAMLENERYIGRWAWNATKWVRVPGKRSRKRVTRPDAERVVREVPELRIVSDEIFQAAQARFRKHHVGRKGRPPGTGNHVYLVSGLLRCGICQGSMTVVGRRVKKGVTYTSFGCTAHYARGAAICPNGSTLSGQKITTTILEAMGEALSKPSLTERFQRRFQDHVERSRRARATEGGDLAQRVREAENRVRNVTEAMAQTGFSQALLEQLRAEEARLAALKAQVVPPATKPPTLPSPDRIAGYLANLEKLLQADVRRGREVLQRHSRPVVLTPEGKGPDRVYRAAGAFNLSTLLAEASGKSGSGGRI